jgi:anti-sigma factor RsiW
MKIERKNLKACAEFADRLVDLSDGELPDGERQLVEAHVVACTGCRAELARLDASLTVLRGAVVLRGAGLQPAVHGTRSVPTTYYAAALSLVLLLAAGFAALRFWGNDDAPEMASVSQEPHQARPALNPPVALDEAAALHQIALIEQQARIQASLDLLPKDPWFAEQRAANEDLLAQFTAAVAAGNAEAATAEKSPSTDGNLEKGETL